MKHILTSLFLITCLLAEAQIPQTINFQGFLTNDQGDAITDTQNMTFTIFRFIDGNQEWSETQENVVITNGIYSVSLGSVNPFSFAFDQAYELEVTVGSEVLAPRIPLSSSAFSLGAYSVFGDSNVFPADGNVGLGTKSPAANLHINTTANAQIKMQDESGEWDINAGLDLFISNSSGEELLTLFNDNNVTIGNTTTSGSDLLVKGDVTANSFSGDGSGLTNIGGSSVWSGSPDISYTGGSVGIGTTTPTKKLHIKSDDGSGDVIINENNSSNTPSLILQRSVGDNTTPLPIADGDALGFVQFLGYNGTDYGLGATISAVAAEDFSSAGSKGTSLRFGTTENGGGFNTRMNIAANGNVGIGTEDPASILHLETEGSNSSDVFLYNYSDTNSPGVLMSKARGTIESPSSVGDGDLLGATVFQGYYNLAFNTYARIDAIGVDGGTGNFGGKIEFKTREPGVSLDTRMTIAADGNMGIGREASTNILEIEGDASKTSAGDWLANSDRRIKTDIQDIDNSLEIIKKLRPVIFKYTDEWMKMHPSIENKYYYNFIAQEYQEIFPESVKESGEYLEGEESEILQIDTYNAQIVSIKALQELIYKIESLEKENASLKSRNSELESKIGQLSSSIEEIRDVLNLKAGADSKAENNDN